MKSFNIVIKFVKCHPDAQLPAQNDGDVGFDLKSVEHVDIPPGKTVGVHTGLKFADQVERLFVYDGGADPCIVAAAVPFFKVEGRSGLALKNSVFPIGGILDPSYRGEIVAIMHNAGDSTHHFSPGDKVAQMVCYLTYANNSPIIVSVKEVTESTQTSRGDSGFGSTGA